MRLPEVATDVAVTTEQRDRGVAVVNDTDASLAARLEPFAARLPCAPEQVATIVTARVARGESVVASSRAAAVAPMTARKALYRVGEPIPSLDAEAETALATWLDADCSWRAARDAADDPAAFALAAYAATHEPIPGASEVVADWLADA